MKDRLEKELEVITKATQIAQKSEGLTSTIKQILLMAKDAFNIGNGEVLINENGKLKVFTLSGYLEGALNLSRVLNLSFDIKRGVGITGLAAKKQETIIVNDIKKNHHYIKGIAGSQSEMAVPIIINQQVIGVLNFESTEKNAFSEADAKNAQALAVIIGFIITSLENEKKLQEDVKKLEALINTTNELSKASHNLSRTLSTIIKVIKDYFGYKYFDILLKDKDGNLVPSKTSKDFPIEAIRNFKANINRGEGLTGTAAKLGKIVCVNDVLKDKRYIAALSKIRSEIVLPILVGKNLIGVLDIEDTRPNIFTKDFIQVLKVLAIEIGIAINNAKLNEKMKELAATDELTGLSNYRSFRKMLDREISRSKRYGKKFSLAMFDIDYFKCYNDKNGHDQGNVALEEIGEILLKLSRENDVPARFGGDEFIVILLETGKEAAYKFAERVRKTIEQTEFKGEYHQPNGKLTLSGGIAEFSVDGDMATKIIKAVDAACYKAKYSGRNKIAIFGME
jgi:diguanylate cyclase (GGDEF)-like protein